MAKKAKDKTQKDPEIEKALSDARLKKLFRNLPSEQLKRRLAREDQEEEDTKPKKVSECVACNGEIVRHKSRKYNPASGPMIFGPGSKNQFYTETSYKCNMCGLVYAHPPKPGTTPRQSRSGQAYRNIRM